MLGWKTEGTKLYQQLPAEMTQGWKPCQPAHQSLNQPEIPENPYLSWKQKKQ
jgi:hypothetical protein